MARTSNQILTRLGYELKDPTFTNWTKDELLTYLNEAIRALTQRIASTHPEYWLNSGQTYTASSNIVANTANYDLATDFYAMVQVQLTDSDGNVEIVQPIDVERQADTDAAGYMLINSDIYLYPTPDTSVTSGLKLYYVAMPADVTVSSTTVPLSTHFEDVLDLYVVLKAKARQEETVANFSAFYQKAQSTADMLVAQTNKSEGDAGMRSAFRLWI